MGGGDLNTKKSWHPSTIKNQERVWKAEQAVAEEKKRILELQREREQENDRERLNEMAQLNFGTGGAQPSGDNRLHWMYNKPDKQVQHEDYLLGKEIGKSDESSKPQHAIPAVSRRVIGSSMTSSLDNTQVDLVRKMREDPLLMVKERERAARAALLNNPLHRKKLAELLRKEQDQKESSKAKSKIKKKSKKKDKNLDSMLAAKLNALSDVNELNLGSLLNSDESLSDSSQSNVVKSKKNKKKKREQSRKTKKKDCSDSDSSGNDTRRKGESPYRSKGKLLNKNDRHFRDKDDSHKDSERSTKSKKDKPSKSKKRRSDSTSDSDSQTKVKKKIANKKFDFNEFCLNSPDKNQHRDYRRDSPETSERDSPEIYHKRYYSIARDYDSPDKSRKRCDSPDRSTKGRDSSDRNTKQQRERDSLDRSTKRRDSLDRSTKRRDSPERSSKRRNSPESSTKRRDSPERSSKRRNSPERSTKRRDSPERSTKRRDSPDKSTKRHYSPDRSNSKVMYVKKVGMRDKRQGMSEAERTAKLAEMAAAGKAREVERGIRVANQRAADAVEATKKGPRSNNEARALPDSLESRIRSNRHYIQRDKTHMDQNFARR